MSETVFNRRLKLAMEKRGIDKAELTKMTGVSKDTIGSWMRKDHLPGGVYNLISVADALDVSIDWLVGRKRKNAGSDKSASGD